jgi:hypothetical protein
MALGASSNEDRTACRAALTGRSRLIARRVFGGLRRKKSKIPARVIRKAADNMNASVSGRESLNGAASVALTPMLRRA